MHPSRLRQVFLPLIAGIVVLVGCDIFSSDKASHTKTPAPTSISTDQTVSGSFSKASSSSNLYDTVSLTFSADSGYTYGFLLNSEEGTISSEKILTSAGSEAPSSSSYPYSGDDSLTFPCGKTGTYTLVFWSYKTGADYTVKMSASKGLPSGYLAADAFEVDDLRSLAKTITADSAVQNRSIHGYSSNSGDVDWIAVKCDSGKTYSIHYTYNSSYSLYMSVENSDSNSVSLTSSNSVYTNGEDVYYRSFEVSKSGTYRINVNGSYAMAYEIAVTAKQGISISSIQDGYEADNTLSTAKSITTDSVFQTHSMHANTPTSSYSNDIDWIAVKCDSGKTYKVYYHDVEDDIAVQLYSADSTSISSSAYTASPSMVGNEYFYYRSFAVAKTATYYIRASTYYATTYSIAVTATQGIPASAVVDAYESDDTRATAKTIASDSSWQTRTLHTASSSIDPDLVAFAADSGKTYRFQMIDTSGYVYMAAFASDSSRVVTRDSTSGSRDILLIPVTKSGTYYVRVYSSYATGYKVALTKSAGLPSWGEPEAGEPDHGMSTAMTIATDSTALNRTIAVVDTDWVKIPVVKGRIYTIYLKNTASSYDYTISASLLNASGSTISSGSYLDYGDTWTNTYEATADGAIYLKLQNSYSYNSYLIPYVLRVSSTVLPIDPMEPDSNMTTAATLASDSAAVSRWTRYLDEDWMKITVDSGRKVTTYVNLKNSASYYLYYQLYSRDSVVVDNGSVSSISTGTLAYTPRYSGPMFLRVYTSSSAVLNYGVRVENFPVDVTEPDDNMTTAKSIPTDSTVVARALSDVDEDWLKFPVKAGTTYRIGWLADNNVNVYLFGSDSTRLNYYTYSTSSSLLQTATKDDTWYIRTLPYSSGTTAFAVHLTVSTVANDSDEPANGTLAGARVIKTDSTAQKARIVATDKDMFQFQADSGTAYFFSSSSDYSMSFQILGGDSSVLYTTSSTSSFVYTPSITGTLFVNAMGYSSSSVFDYALAAKAYKPDSYEKDGGLSLAKPLATDGMPQAHTLLGNDDDWMAISVDSGVVYTLGMTNNNTLYTSIYTDDSLVLGSMQSNYSGTSSSVRTFSTRRTCKVYLRVSPYSYASYPITSYEVWVSKPEI